MPFEASYVALYLTAKLRYLFITKNSERREARRGPEREIVKRKPVFHPIEQYVVGGVPTPQYFFNK